MGAGCIDAANADVSIQDVGLVFGATYVIYDVVAVDGLQLIRLRNPPGDHGGRSKTNIAHPKRPTSSPLDTSNPSSSVY